MRSRKDSLQRKSTKHDERFVILLSVTFVLGMAVALALIFVWRQSPAAMAQTALYHAAVAVCPPFLLVGVFSALEDSTFALVLTAGTIVFANGSLYAGLSAFAYWVFLSLGSKKEPGAPPG